MMSELDIESIRESFPSLREFTFFDTAGLSPIPNYAIDAVKEFIDEVQTIRAGSPTKQHVRFIERSGEARREAAKLVGGNEDEIAIVSNTNEALNIVANIIPWEKGDNLIVNDLEYPANVAPWWLTQERFGVEMRVVHHVDGRLRLSDFEEQMNRNTKLVAVSSVQWSNGLRMDLESLGRTCKMNGSYFLVDAIQSLGALEMDVNRANIDFLAAGGHKWLNSPFGASLLYCRENHVCELTPFALGDTTATMPPDGWEKYFHQPESSPIHPYEFLETARRFEKAGWANNAGIFSLRASLRRINDLGVRNIEKRILHLTDSFIKGLQDLGIKVTSPLEMEHRSGIVSFEIFEGIENEKVLEPLINEKIIISMRYSAGQGGLRASIHYYNTEEEIQRLLHSLAKFCKK